MQTTSSVTKKPTQRLDWIDAIKGATIILVVAGHAADFATPYAWYGSLPDTIMAAFRPLRMPLFFMIAGFFFLRRIDKPWTWWIKNRIAPFFYLFIIWTFIWMGVEKSGLWVKGTPTSSIMDAFVNPNQGPWFILALALYFTIMKLLSPLPIWLQISAGAVISIPTAIGFIPVNPGWINVLSYFFIFQLGAYGKTGIIWLANRANLWWLAGAGATWVGCLAVIVAQGGEFISPMRIPATISGVVVGIVGVVLLHRYAPWLNLPWFGKRTLPIYLLHCPIIGVLYFLSPAWPAGSIMIQFGIPLLAIIISIAASVALEKPLRKIPGLLVAPWRGQSVQTLPEKLPRQITQG